ncbi:putative secreted protein (Por secretion system target) [Winogradskyella eximia]|uniref:Putative secreted protein (Por secretion system target) n=2 Tax=Winogradskyella eximia TaxID=262006 RepID=A0A3D9HB30_9FLAO|nr:putative secreted protein (Por secretion system target) [Winogradskyella eximia]
MSFLYFCELIVVFGFMKYFYVICFFLFQFNLVAQNQELSVFTCGELEDTSQTAQSRSSFHTTDNPDNIFVDRFGNEKQKNINPNIAGQQRALPLAPDYISPEGLFAIYLTDLITDNSIQDFNSNSGYRNVIAQIFADLEQIIIENPSTGVTEPVKIELQSMSVNSGVLASASSYYDYLGAAAGTIVEGEVWKAINSGFNDPDNWDGLIRVNFFHSWYSDFNNPSGITGTNTFDMYAVLLHEIMHALGFASGIDELGNPKNGRAFLKYDNLLHTDTNDDLIVSTGLDWSFNSAVSINTITNGCPSTSEIRLGDNNLPVHSPQVFSNGSSLSHVDLNNDCNYPLNDFIMAYAIAAETSRRPLSQEFDILCSLNYNLSTQFGNNNIIEFGNPAIITAITNNTSNVIAYSGCEAQVFGINDFENPITQPTVENCQGNTLNILEQDLLSNDISSLGLALEVSNLSLNGSLITTFTGVAPNRTFIITPNFVGDLQLIYLPKDTNGNLGNNTFVNIKVIMCPNFGCINTSDCNLICNPEIDFLDNPSRFCILYGHSSGNNVNTIPGWRFKFGTTEWMLDDNSTCDSSGLGFSIGRNTTSLPNTDPSSGRLNFYGNQFPYNSGPNSAFESESTMTAVTLQPNVKYLLSYHKSDGIDPAYVGTNTPSNNTQPNIGLDVSLSDNATNYYNLSYVHDRDTQLITVSNTVNNNFFNNSTLLINDDAIDFNWSQTVTTFNSPSTIDNSNSFLVFSHAIGNSYINSGRPYATAREYYFLALDRVELIEDHLQDTPNNYIVDCGATQSIGIDLCSVSNMQYEWWDITNGIQLTDLDDTTSIYTDGILNTLLASVNYTINAINSNGSIITLSNLENSIELELRRTFPVTYVNTTTTPASTALNNINDPDNTVTVNITVLNEAPTDATFTTTSLSDCLEYTFQATETYETHEWDFDNDGVVDVSGSGTDLANTNPSYTFPGSGTYVVTHMVSNECGSLSYQESIVLACGCSSSTTWNGTTWSNGNPDINTEAIINGNYDTLLNGSFSACELVVNAGATLFIQNATYVEVQSIASISGNLWVETHGAFVQNLDLENAFILNPGGNALVNKQTTVVNNWYDYTYWSSPIVDETIGDALDIAPANRRFWYNAQNYLDQYLDSSNNTILGSDDIDDDGNDWQIATAGSIMTPGVGYAATVSPIGVFPGAYLATFEGAFNNAIIETPIYVNGLATDNDWNFIGNPYPSAIDFDNLYALNSGLIGGSAYLWSHASPPDNNNDGNQGLNFNANDYAIITVGSGNIAGSGTLTDNNIPNSDNTIPSGQGFFVKGLSNGTLTFNNSMRKADLISNNQFFRNSNTTNTNRLWLNLTTESGIFNQILIAYVDGATSGFDGFSFDATRSLYGGNTSILFTEIENDTRRFAIQGKNPSDLNLNEVIPFAYYSGVDDTTVYTISIPQLEGGFLTNNTIYLRDKLLNVVHNLNAEHYSFYSEMGEFKDRFEIVFNSENLSIKDKEIAAIEVYPNPTTSVIHVKSETTIKSLQLFNNLGQLILSKPEVNYLDLSRISEGIYFLKVIGLYGNTKSVPVIKK